MRKHTENWEAREEHRGGTQACFNGCENLPGKDVKALALCSSMHVLLN
jgi:hypothetical protein